MSAVFSGNKINISACQLKPHPHLIPYFFTPPLKKTLNFCNLLLNNSIVPEMEGGGMDIKGNSLIWMLQLSVILSMSLILIIKF